MKNKKMVTIVFAISIVICIIGFGIFKFFSNRNENINTVEKDNEVKSAGQVISPSGNTSFRFTLRGVVSGDENNTICCSSTGSGSCQETAKCNNYYFDIEIIDNSNNWHKVNYTWNAYMHYSSKVNFSTSTNSLNNFVFSQNNVNMVNIKNSDNREYKVLKLISKYASNSSSPTSTLNYDINYTSSQRPIYIVLDDNYNVVYQVPYPQWQKLKYNDSSKTYTSSDGVKIDTTNNCIYYLKLSDQAGYIEQRKVTFDGDIINDTLVQDSKKEGTIK